MKNIDTYHNLLDERRTAYARSLLKMLFIIHNKVGAIAKKASSLWFMINLMANIVDCRLEYLPIEVFELQKCRFTGRRLIIILAMYDKNNVKVVDCKYCA